MTIKHKITDLLHNRFARRRRTSARARTRDGLLQWGATYLPKHFTKRPSALHVWLANELDALERANEDDHNERHGKKINLIGPRGAAKSTIATLAHVLRAAVRGDEPYIWILSDTKLQAQTHLENIKTELEQNEAIAEDYPDAAGRGPRWRAAAIELNNGVVIEAYGTGQRIRGRRRGEHRPTLIIADDLQNERHIASAAARDGSLAWFFGALEKAGTPQTHIVNLATALHRHAIALVLDRTPGWRSRTFRSIVTWPTRTDLWKRWETIYCDPDNPNHVEDAGAFFDANETAMRAGAEILWPDVEDLPVLMKMRAESGPAAFAREKQSDPVDPEVCEWPDAYFDDAIWFDDWPSELQVRVIALDPSKGRDARRGDYSAFVVLGLCPQGVTYVEADLARRPTPRMVDDGVALVQRFKPDAFGVEANQFQELLCGEFERALSAGGVHGVAPVAIHNHAAKTVRIRRLGSLLAGRRIRFHAKSPGTRLLVDQLRDFPIAAHDDGPDAAEMALRLAGEILNRRRRRDDGLGDRLV